MVFMCKFKNEFIENFLFVIKKFYVILIVVFRINENNNVFRFVFVV